MVKCLTHGLRGFNRAVQRRLATLTVTMLVSSCWQLSSEVELRRIFDVCKRRANSGSHEFVKKNMVRYMRPHGQFAHCSCKNAVRQSPVLASCIEIYCFATAHGKGPYDGLVKKNMRCKGVLNSLVVAHPGCTFRDSKSLGALMMQVAKFLTQS